MARNFDTVTDRGNATALVVTTPLTMVHWMNVPSDDFHSGMGLFNIGASLSVFSLATRTTGNLAAYSKEEGGATVLSLHTGNYAANEWFHIGGVYASTTSRICYFNGDAAGEDTAEVDPVNATDVVFSNWYDDGYLNLYTPRLADAAIWNVALTDSEMKILAAGYSPLFVRPQNLIHYFPLWGNGTTEPDLAGGSDVTFTGTVPAYPHPPIIQPTAQIIQFPPVAAAAGATLQGSLMTMGVGI